MERQFVTFEEASAELEISTRQIRTDRKNVENRIGRSLTRRIKLEGDDRVVFTLEGWEILKAWRNRQSDVDFDEAYCQKPERLIHPDVMDVEAGNVAIVQYQPDEDSDYGAIVPASLRLEVRGTSAMVQRLVEDISASYGQISANADVLAEAELAKAREDGALLGAKIFHEHTASKNDMVAKLQALAANHVMGQPKQKKGGKRNAPQSF